MNLFIQGVLPQTMSSLPLMKLGKLVEDVSNRKSNNKQPTDDAQGSYQPPGYSNWDRITVTHSGHADGGPPPADRDGLQL